MGAARDHLGQRPPCVQNTKPPLKARGPVPDGPHGVRVCCGTDAWEQGKRPRACGHTAMVLPSDDHPNPYRWPADGLAVLVLIAADLEIVVFETLGTEIVYAGTLRVVICDPENQKLDNPTVGFKPRRERA